MNNNGYRNIEELQQFNFSESPSIGILSILSEQRNKINEMIENNFDEDKIIEFNIMIGTPEEFQGNERDIMIITIGLDDNCRWGKQHYENYNRFNVATSRAKYFTYFIYAGIPSNAVLLRNYLRTYP